MIVSSLNCAVIIREINVPFFLRAACSLSPCLVARRSELSCLTIAIVLCATAASKRDELRHPIQIQSAGARFRKSSAGSGWSKSKREYNGTHSQSGDHCAGEGGQAGNDSLLNLGGERAARPIIGHASDGLILTLSRVWAEESAFPVDLGEFEANLCIRDLNLSVPDMTQRTPHLNL